MKSKFSKYSDEKLIFLIKGEKSDSDSAFTELYHRYAAKVKAYCSCAVNNEEISEDIFQETFIRFYKKAKIDYDIFNAGGLLITIARNLCLNYHRNKKETIPVEDLNILVESNNPYEKNELYEMITMSLELMDYKYKEAFILRELEGFSIREISEITGVTIACAKARVLRAYNKLVEILDPYLKDLQK